MKKYFSISLVAVFVLVGLTVASNAMASIDITSVSVSPSTVSPGENTTVSVTVDRTGSQCENNWVSTKITINGDTITPSQTAYVLGSQGSPNTEDFIIASPTSAGTYDVIVEAWKGAETPPPTCTPALGDSYTASAALTVEEPDTIAPVITVTGENPIRVRRSTVYVDAGATASDNIDGDITANITSVSTVDTSVSGFYTVTYNVSDSASNAATATRTVEVYFSRSNKNKTGETIEFDASAGGSAEGSTTEGSTGGTETTPPAEEVAGFETTPVEGEVLGAEKFVFTKWLKLGSMGDEVKELQKFLNAAEYGSITVDGFFGLKTKAAVIKFQIANGLVGDGIVGPLTRAVLNK